MTNYKVKKGTERFFEEINAIKVSIIGPKR